VRCRPSPRLPLGLLSCAAAFAVAAPAHAGVLLSSAQSCSSEMLSQPFQPWFDYSSYAAVPGGAFESGQASWSLSGGAAVTPGNESYHVNSPTDSSSLSLPDGSSATSPSMCVGINDPTVRLMARNGGSPFSSLRVDVLFEDALGKVHSAPLAWLSSGSSWQPTMPFADHRQPAHAAFGRRDGCRLPLHGSGHGRRLARRRRVRRSVGPRLTLAHRSRSRDNEARRVRRRGRVTLSPADRRDGLRFLRIPGCRDAPEVSARPLLR
jgi:hypothetical protein